MRKPLYLVAVALCFSTDVYAKQCPSPTEQLKTDIKGRIEGDVATLLKSGKLNTVGDIETRTQEFFHLYPDANRAALEQNTLSIVCNNVLESTAYSQEFKQEIVRRLLDKTLGDSKKINWKVYNFEFTDDKSPGSVLSAPSAISVAYPDGWIVRISEVEMGLVAFPGANSDYGDYDISFRLQVLGTTAAGLIENLEQYLKEPEFPISPAISDYQRWFNVEKDVERQNLPNVSVNHVYRTGKIKVDTGTSIESQSILFDVATEGNRVKVASLYVNPFWGRSGNSEEVLVSRFECNVPRQFGRICGWLFSRIIVRGSTAEGD
jgi:hypothetical protein